MIKSNVIWGSNVLKSTYLVSKVFTLALLLVIGQIGYAEEPLYKGEFKADSLWTIFEGHWEIIEDDGVSFLILKDDFKAEKAPDLKFFLHKLNIDDINSDNAASKDNAVLVKQLSTEDLTTFNVAMADRTVVDFGRIKVR